MKNLATIVWWMISVVAMAAAATMATAGPVGSVFRPGDYMSIDLGGNSDLNVSSGSVSINTGTGSGAAPTITIGIATYNGVYATSQNSAVRMAVFTFDSVIVATGVTFDVTGNLGVVLASKDTFGFGGTISVSGKSTTSSAGGAGGPGAEGGNRTSSYLSNPPPANAGDGANYATPGHGRGYGGGTGGYMNNVGSGGGYGGKGRNSSHWSRPINGGLTYGDALLVSLYGGSGGGAGSHPPEHGGGGGGGSIELVALGQLTVSGSVLANGGNGRYSNSGLYGGGGSGGGILLAAPTIRLDGTALIGAQGGRGGGGGRVAFYTGNFWPKAIADLEKVNGDANGNGQGTGGADFEGGKTPLGLTFSGTVDVRGSDGGGKGTFYAIYAPPPKGAVLVVR